MSIKDILVHVDNTAYCYKRIQAAFSIARTFESQVNGLFVPERVPYEWYGDSMSRNVIDAFNQIKFRSIESARELFDDESGDWSSKSTFGTSDGNVVNRLVANSMVQDLIVLGQPKPSDIHSELTDTAHMVPLVSGATTLVVPHIGCRETIGKNIIIGWDGKREAAKAVHNAMPFLQKAEVVNVFCIGKPMKESVFETDIGVHLSRHGVVAEVHKIQQTDIGIAEFFLSRASDYNADLMVMGMFGHSRLREYVLGGVTRTLLQSMTLPVLFSH